VVAVAQNCNVVMAVITQQHRREDAYSVDANVIVDVIVAVAVVDIADTVDRYVGCVLGPTVVDGPVC
jgi:hypothetical protein